VAGHPLQDRGHDRFGAEEIAGVDQRLRWREPLLLAAAPPLPGEQPTGAVHDRFRLQAVGPHGESPGGQLGGLVGLGAG
jgi:hypothetical protein